MNPARLAAVALIVVGVLGLTYRGFTYTRDRHEMHVGSVSVSMNEHRTIVIPVWAGAAAILLGTGLLMVPSKRS